MGRKIWEILSEMTFGHSTEIGPKALPSRVKTTTSALGSKSRYRASSINPLLGEIGHFVQRSTWEVGHGVQGLLGLYRPGYWTVVLQKMWPFGQSFYIEVELRHICVSLGRRDESLQILVKKGFWPRRWSRGLRRGGSMIFSVSLILRMLTDS